MKLQELLNRLSEIKDKLTKIEQASEKRIYLYCEAENSYAVNKFLFEDLGLRFVIETGIDSGPPFNPIDCFEIIYHYSDDESGCVVNLKVFIRDREKPAIESITPFLPAAEWKEREIHDILGIDFKNHPNLKRLILSDDWPEGVYPLRKEVKK